MVIETNKQESDEFYKETVNITVQAANLWKNPRYQFRNMYVRFTALLIASAVLIALLTGLAIINKPDFLIITGIVIMALVVLLNAFSLINMNAQRKSLKEGFKPKTLTFDEEFFGLLNNDGSSATKKSWDQFVCVRVSPQTISFIPKKSSDAIILFVSREYENQICGWLRENRPDVLIVTQNKI